MTDLVSYVPPHEPADDTLAFAGKAALSAIPVVGPIAAETLAHALDTRQAERQHDFNLKVAYALTEALERLDVPGHEVGGVSGLVKGENLRA